RAGGAVVGDRWTDVARRFVAGEQGRSVVLTGDECWVGEAADVARPGASVLKVFVAAAACLDMAAERLDPSESVAVSDLPTSINPSMLESLAPGHRFSLAELTCLSLSTSENRIGEFMVQRVGIGRVNAVAASLGCPGTALRVGFGDEMLSPLGRANVTTAADCATLLAAIWRRDELRVLRAALRSSLFNARILARMPDDVTVSHKTGSLSGVANDIGVIHSRRLHRLLPDGWTS
ncbi:MAG TPA: class A beta-lactamase-related serine hydrolase, partial [Ilumatobacteraceae bacterium]|nr:class A beta-lactamase-related serine hydrolase [Ilumatobacteraceae bacterium]